MANLPRSTRQADSIVEDCLCVRRCPGCSHDGRWHTHVDEACPVHPDTLVDEESPSAGEMPRARRG